MQIQQQTSLKDIDYGYYFKHYLRLFWMWKWYSLIAGPLAAVIAIFVILHLGLLKSPPLPATVLIGLDSPKNRTFDDISENNGNNGDNKAQLLLNRTFLQSIVKKLSLQFSLSGYSRYEIFDTLSIDTNALMGSFKFEIDPQNKDLYKILYNNQKVSIKNKILISGSISSLDTISFSGIYLKFTNSFLQDPHNFNFYIVPMRSAVDKIINNLKVISPNPNDQKFFITATLEGSDYPLVTQTVNSIANTFIENSSNLQKKRTKETITELEKQLAAADEQQSISNNALRAFLDKNPSIGLSQSTQQTMSQLVTLESGSYETNNTIETLRTLRERYNAAQKDDRLQIINEIITFLLTHGNLAAPTLQANLIQITQEKETASQNYSKTHPIFKEIDNKFSLLFSRVIDAADSYAQQQKKLTVDRNASIQRITSKLQGMPSQELQLAELQKRQQINSDIYSKLLSKYNEAKVSETVQNGDMYVMEYAVQPIAPSRFQQLVKCAGIVLFSFLFFAFGPAIGFDLVDKTARSEQSLVRLLPYRFLETIPKIKLPRKKEQTFENNQMGNQPPKRYYSGEILINEPGLKPASVIELFRSLTTKIQLDLYENPEKSITVTSFEMDEGKSTVAANMAISFAEHGIKTVLIDCDLRRGVSHKIFSLKKGPGLTDYLLSKEESNDLQFSEVPLQKTPFSNLWLLSAGAPIDNPQRLLRSPLLAKLKEHLINQSFFVIFDSPPVAIAADAAILSNLTSKYVLIIRAGRTNVVKFRKMLSKDYPMIHKKVLGVVLNMGENTVPTRYYSYYYNNSKRHPRSDT